MKPLYLFLCIGLFSQFANAQLPKYISHYSYGDPVDRKEVKHWLPTNTTDYTGIYHFGESEGEWDLYVLKVDSIWIFQAQSHDWGKSDKNKEGSWISKFNTYNAVTLNQNKFSSGKLKGLFVTYKDGKTIKGIVLTSDPVNDEASADSALIGSKDNEPIDIFFAGDYPELSYRVVDDSYLKSKTKEQLQLMRNEIFARYDMRFNKSGKMHAHFIKKSWYDPCRDVVSQYLTEIEKRNIEKIVLLEKK